MPSASLQADQFAVGLLQADNYLSTPIVYLASPYLIDVDGNDTDVRQRRAVNGPSSHVVGPDTVVVLRSIETTMATNTDSRSLPSSSTDAS